MSHDHRGELAGARRSSALMGNSMARRWLWLGTYHAWRTRGRETLQSIEPWIKIAMGGAFLSGYRNLGGLTWWQALGVGLGIVLIAELMMLLLGAFDFRNGVISRQTQLNNEQDPWKVRTLALLEDIAHRSNSQPVNRAPANAWPEGFTRPMAGTQWGTTHHG